MMGFHVNGIVRAGEAEQLPQMAPSSLFSFPLGRHAFNGKEGGGFSLAERQKYLCDTIRGDASGEAIESWSRKDILHLLCLEMGKERKYTGVSKSKMVDHLLGLVAAREKAREEEEAALPNPPLSAAKRPRRLRKGVHPSRLPTLLSNNNSRSEEKLAPSPPPLVACGNIACKAPIAHGSSFCRRCSCCLCYRFDENKDPSLWIVCSPHDERERETKGERDTEGERDKCNGCGLSCHVECALERGLAGVVANGERMLLLDGSYQCASCGTIIDLIGCWRKQLTIAKDARRVDTLCYRLLLSHRLLNRTVRYRNIHELVGRAIRKLQAEVGSLLEGSVKFARVLVNRLSSGTDVQQLIDLALKTSEDAHVMSPTGSASTLHEDVSCTILFHDISVSSITVEARINTEVIKQDLVGYRLWHCQKSSDACYLTSPTFVLGIKEKAVVSNLQANTEYSFRLVLFSERGGNLAQTEAHCSTKCMEVLSFPTISGPPMDLNCIAKTGICEPNEAQRNLLNAPHIDPIGIDPCEDVKCPEIKPSVDVIVNSFGAGNEFKSCGLKRIRNEARGKPLDKTNLGIVNDKQLRCPSNDLLSADLEASSVDGGMRKCLNGDGNNGKQVVIDEPIKLLQQGKESFRDANGIANGIADESLETLAMPIANMLCVEEASGPSMSENTRCEETDTISPGAIGSPATNYNGSTMEILRGDELESNGHESWAMQYQSGKLCSFRSEPTEGVFREENTGRLERVRSCFTPMAATTATTTTTIGEAVAPFSVSKSFEFCVKVIRWLELEGHLEKEFRLKFLSWFSLRATEHEKRTVSTFIDTFQESPTSLAEQLVDAFADIVSTKRQNQVLPNGFCDRLWH